MEFRKHSVEAYLAAAGARTPTPGGGSIAALAGALAAAAGEMAARFSVSGDAQTEIRDAISELIQCREGLTALVDRDAEAYEGVARAQAMPKGTRAERTARRAAMTVALRTAMEPPLSTIRYCLRVGEAAARLAQIGNPNLLIDVGVGAVLAEAAASASRLAVESNLRLLADEDLRLRTLGEMDDAAARLKASRERVARLVAAHMEG